MDYQQLLDFAAELGYKLAMNGAETFRVEDSINRILSAYGVKSEAFAIPNCLTVSIRTPDGESLTRLRRIGFHGNDLDSLERFSNLSRKICAQVPAPDVAMEWLQKTTRSCITYSLPFYLVGNFLCAFGFAIFFGGILVDSLIAGLCGVLVGLTNYALNTLKVNPFFSTIASAFIMAFAAYAIGLTGIANSTDAAIIGTLMLLVPGLIFTNAMRDIIFGDTNSGINRIVQVFMIAAAIALGTGVAWNLFHSVWRIPYSADALDHTFVIQCLCAFVGCYGISIVFNIHGPGGLLCALGGTLSWACYLLSIRLWNNEALSYFLSALVAAGYSEIMARVRKCPAIAYLVIAIFPLIPGAGIYYTTNFLVLGDMAGFSAKGFQTIIAAGSIAIGLLSVSTIARLATVWREKRKAK